MRVLLAAYGSRGDIEPIVALAVQLRALGVGVVCCAPPDHEFQRLFARANVPLTPFHKSWKSWATDASTAEEEVPSADAYVRGYIDATWDVMSKAAEGCDLIVASGMLHFIARSVSDRTGAPHRFVLFCPSLLPAQGWQPLARAPIDAHRASVGLPPVGEMHEHLFTGRPLLAADTVLSPPGDAKGFDVSRSDAWLLKDDRPLPPDLLAFLSGGPPPVYVGFGSMRVPQDSAIAAIGASRAHGRRIIVGSGWAELASIDDREDSFVTGEVNQQALFREVAAVIHHGGAGTTTTAARAGAPQIVVPQAVDQPYWARRVGELGIGVAHEGPNPTVASLSEALVTALSPGTRARALAVAVDMATDGAATAARRLIDEIGVHQSP